MALTKVSPSRLPGQPREVVLTEERPPFVCVRMSVIGVAPPFFLAFLLSPRFVFGVCLLVVRPPFVCLFCLIASDCGKLDR